MMLLLKNGRVIFKPFGGALTGLPVQKAEVEVCELRAYVRGYTDHSFSYILRTLVHKFAPDAVDISIVSNYTLIPTPVKVGDKS